MVLLPGISFGLIRFVLEFLLSQLVDLRLMLLLLQVPPLRNVGFFGSRVLIKAIEAALLMFCRLRARVEMVEGNEMSFGEGGGAKLMAPLPLPVFWILVVLL